MQNKGVWNRSIFGIGFGELAKEWVGFWESVREHTKQKGLEYVYFWDRVWGTLQNKGDYNRLIFVWAGITCVPKKILCMCEGCEAK